MLYQQRVMQEVATRTPGALQMILNNTPWLVKKYCIQKWMQHSFQSSIRNGDLIFFENKSLNLIVSDIKLRFNITMKNNQLHINEYNSNYDCEFTGNFYDLLLIAAQKRDPDTLFFQRKLMISGDTELGLSIKNWLASLDFNTSLHPITKDIFEKITPWIDEIATQGFLFNK